MVRDRSSRFSDNQRDILGEDRIRLTSVGVDIGSSTSHLVFSRLELELQQDRYVMVERTVLKQSDILLTPYRDATTIDGDALETFIEQQYAAAGLSREDVDTGALILTGVALQRDNARAIGELFADEAGRFVAVTAGDNLEAILAAHGSGAIDLSVGRPGGGQRGRRRWHDKSRGVPGWPSRGRGGARRWRAADRDRRFRSHQPLGACWRANRRRARSRPSD